MIKDKIGKGEITIQYCPSGDMWADINTKALQGALFYKMRARLMGISKNYDDEVERLNTQPGLLPLKECGGPTMSPENTAILKKAGAFKKAFAIATEELPEAHKIKRYAVAALMIRALT